MADALLSPAVGSGLWLATGTAIAVSSRRMKASLDHRQAPLMGVMGALVFAVQMLNFTIPGTGSSGHFAGGLLLAILLGPHAAFLTIASVITVQALFFADGGLLALGANIFNMGFCACYLVYPLIYKPLSAAWAGKSWQRWAAFISAMAALQLGAFGVVIETSASGIAELPFAAFLLAMLPIHLAIGVGEGLITMAVIDLLTRVEPAMLVQAKDTPSTGFLPGRKALVTLTVLAVLAGGVVSWFASPQPDGLEWSIARLIGQKKELAAPSSVLHQASARLQESLAFMPDYAFTEGEGDVAKSLGTSLSGLVGGSLVLLLAGLLGFVLKRRPATREAA